MKNVPATTVEVVEPIFVMSVFDVFVFVMFGSCSPSWLNELDADIGKEE